jgi:hypothetical protein
MRLDPKSALAYNNRGAAWREKGDLDRAVADFDQAIRLDPKIANPYANRGPIWRAKGDLDRAIADYSHAIVLDPKYPDAYANRGLAYEGNADYGRARADFKAALALPARFVFSRRFQAMAKARLAVLSNADTVSVAPHAVVATASAATPQASVPASAAASPRDPGRRIALVIGNGAYANANTLPNPPNDARAVAKSMREIGFDVSEGIDLDRAGMQRLISGFLLKGATARIALLFYAGHGMQVDGRNYLVPVDAKLATATDLAAEMTEVDQVLAGLDDQIRTNIVILNACRDNPLVPKAVTQPSASRSVVVRSGLAAPSALGAGATLGARTLIAFATAPGQVALDGDGANSPFSSALVRHLATPGLEVQQMLTRVRAEVVATTESRQVPWSNSSLLGEIYLAGGAP